MSADVSVRSSVSGCELVSVVVLLSMVELESEVLGMS